jgi:hypothetical protein
MFNEYYYAFFSKIKDILPNGNMGYYLLFLLLHIPNSKSVLM